MAKNKQPLRTYSRPTGTPFSEATETTNLSEQEKREVSQASSFRGLQIRAQGGPEAIRQREEIIKSVLNPTPDTLEPTIPLKEQPPEQPIEQPQEELQPEVPLETEEGQPEEQQMFSGGVTPITADDIFDVATLGVGGIGIKGGVKVGKGLALPIAKKTKAIALAKKAISKVSKSNIQNVLKTAKKLTTLKSLIVGGAVVTLFESKLSSVDSALSQVRESLDAPVQNVKNGVWTVEEGIEELDNLEEAIDDYEKSAMFAGKFSLKARFFGRLLPIQQRIKKLRIIADGKRRDILLNALQPIPEDQQQLAEILDDLKGGN